MIELNKKKLEELLKDVNNEVSRSQSEVNNLDKQLDELQEELVAKKNLKFALETILGLKG